MNKPFRFQKVEHPGGHQDYRIYWLCGGVEYRIGNVRGRLKRHGRYASWAARSDYEGTSIVLSGCDQRRRVASQLLDCLRGMGWGGQGHFGNLCRYVAGEIMQTTRDVGRDS